MNTHHLLSGGLLRLLLPLLLHQILTHAAGGKWEMLLSNIGITAMHMQLLHNDRVMVYDRTDFGLSNISLPNGRCRDVTQEAALPRDCSAHSVEYDVALNKIRPLMVLTDVWCSSGAVMPDGTLIQAGGFKLGADVVRTYTPCNDHSCDWREIGGGLKQPRWYATSQILPDNRQIIIGGRRQFNYEYYPKIGGAGGSYNLPFLVQTNDPRIENNLYPFVFLNSDGNLFIFANNRAILFDHLKGRVARTYPIIPGGDPRSYPSTGSAVLLPLKNDAVGAEVLVCGGAPKGSYDSARRGKFIGALNTCARIRINDPNPHWSMDSMPMPRVMGDMLLLPNGHVLIINGAKSGTAGWELGRDPILSPVTYKPDNPIGSRFEVENPSSRPRMYHSSAVLLRDCRVLVSGSNPHHYYNFTGVLFPTDLSMESFSPSYLDTKYAHLRPKILSPASQSIVTYGEKVTIRFIVPDPRTVVNGSFVMVTMVLPSFTTHSFAMNQRLLVLKRGVRDVKNVGNSRYEVEVVMPVSPNIAPKGYYILFVNYQEIPSPGVWLRLK